ncbi:uncharacterized protein LOC109862500 isoform X3 [Pseudomyrmex gracilis]|uniref:uncharacterized protein LOC109862500 isoform X3 n=1 Tax=Pseudomyrmex gracilis TaxID=219809 RepID=UPI000995C873|nr:uncharacterized protein LOC109862500 isoform X3 [Pseudomyrmex gracilis]
MAKKVSKYYNWDGIIVEITDTEEIHNQIENDGNFATAYFTNAKKIVLKSDTIIDFTLMTDDCPSTSMTDDWPSTSMTDDRSSISMTDDRPSTSMTDDQPSASMIDDRQSEKEKLNKEDTTKENKIVIADDDSTIADWSDPATKLLLASYFERKSKFRDPTKRKKDLWREITDVFNKQGYIISSNALGKKFRNLKTRYSTIKRNNDKKSTGKGRIMWKWYKDMEEIFHEDKSINFDKAITSMDQEDSNAVNNVTDESEILDLSTVNRSRY